MSNPRVYPKFCKFDSRNNLLNNFVQHHIVVRETKCIDATKVTYTIGEKTASMTKSTRRTGGRGGEERGGEERDVIMTVYHYLISVHCSSAVRSN